MSITITPEDPANYSTDLGAIALLLREEASEVKESRKDKRRQDAPPTDDEVAFDLFANELTSLLSVIQDQRIAQSMEAAMNTDYVLIGELEQSNARALEDRAIAVRMQRGEEVSRPPSVASGRISVEGIRSRVQIGGVQPSLSESSKGFESPRGFTEDTDLSASDIESPDELTGDADHPPSVASPASPPRRQYVPLTLMPYCR
jgi:hypothetical protein